MTNRFRAAMLLGVALLGACAEDPATLTTPEQPIEAAASRAQVALDLPTPPPAPSLRWLGGQALAATSTVLYDFNDLAYSCYWDSVLPSPYQGLTFLTTPYLAVCDLGGGNMFLVPDNSFGGQYNPSLIYEVRIQLPQQASAASIQAYTVYSFYVPELIAYDATGAVLDQATATMGGYFAWETLSVAAPGIAQIGLRSGQAINYYDNLSVDYVNDPTTKQDCMDGGWAQYGFKNQGQCVRFIETGKDSR